MGPSPLVSGAFLFPLFPLVFDLINDVLHGRHELILRKRCILVPRLVLLNIEELGRWRREEVVDDTLSEAPHLRFSISISKELRHGQRISGVLVRGP